MYMVMGVCSAYPYLPCAPRLISVCDSNSLSMLLPAVLRPVLPPLTASLTSPTLTSLTLLVASTEPLDAAGAALNAGATVLTTAAGVAILAVVASLGSWLAYESYVLDLRQKRQSARGPAKSRSVDPASPAFVAPRQLWRRSEIAQYDGSDGEDGPVLLAADGLVFNVARARHMYGPGAEYEVMGGADATRYLARNSVKPQSDDEPLNLAERASLGAWVFSLQQKYDCVGRLATAEEAERMDRQDEYFGRMEALVADEARDALELAWERDGPSS